MTKQELEAKVAELERRLLYLETRVSVPFINPILPPGGPGLPFAQPFVWYNPAPHAAACAVPIEWATVYG